VIIDFHLQVFGVKCSIIGEVLLLQTLKKSKEITNKTKTKQEKQKTKNKKKKNQEFQLFLINS